MYFWLRRIHTVVGVIFPAGFIALYLVPMSSAVRGAPAVSPHTVLDLILIALFVFHSIMALLAMYASSMNLMSYSFYGNWMYALRRLCGVIIIPFAAYHLYAMRISRGGFGHLRELMSSTWLGAFYIAGILAMVLYMMSSAQALMFEWGFAATKGSRNSASAIMWCAAIAIAAWCARMVLVL